MPSIKVSVPVPHKGLIANFAPYEQPGDSLIDGSNVLVRDGRLIIRSGFRKLESAGFGERVMGALYYELANGTKRTVAGGISKRKYYDGSVWADITGPAWTGTEDNQARFVDFPSGGTIYLIGVNGKDATVVWDGVSVADAAIGGGAPIAKDVTACANHVIYGNVILGGISYPCSVMYSESNDHTVTKATSMIDVAEGQGTIVAVRNLGVQSFAIYTTKAQYVATAQGGAVPFRVDYRSGQPGPVSPAAVVVGGDDGQFYFGEDCNFYRFDGGTCKAIGDGVQPKIFSSLSPSFRQRSHGVYDRQNREIHWFWIPIGSDKPTAGITYSLKTGAFSPIHSYAIPISASWRWNDQSGFRWADLSGTWTNLGLTYPTWLSMGSPENSAQMLGGISGQTYIMCGQSTDDGYTIPAWWEYPALALAGPGMEIVVEGFEPYYKQIPIPMDLEVRAGTAQFPGGTITYEPAQVFDMSASTFGESNAVSPLAKYEDVFGKVATVRCQVTEVNRGMEFYGGVARIQSREARRT